MTHGKTLYIAEYKTYEEAKHDATSAINGLRLLGIPPINIADDTLPEKIALITLADDNPRFFKQYVWKYKNFEKSILENENA